jgi:hypothetical protein
VGDLVRFITLTPQPFLNHVEHGGRHFYFFYLPLSSSPMLYYAEAERKVDGSYITFSRMSGNINFSGKPSFDAQSLDIPVLEVESTSLTELLG